MKKYFILLSLILCFCIISGCAGTPVIYHQDCDCPEVGTDGTGSTAVADGELKLGLALVTGVNESADADAEADGEAKYDVTMVSVLVDGKDVIKSCIIDGVSASVRFDAEGKIIGDTSEAPKTKNELGENYGMVAYGGAKAEWNEQAQALADYAVGKTVKELRSGAVDETGKAPKGSDLASSATIYLAGYVSAIEEAVTNAKSLGAKEGDTLKMAAQSTLESTKGASADEEGNAQLDTTVTAVTIKDGVITSCLIDSVQAKVAFTNEGKITTDIKAPVKTKNRLGKDYGMVAYGGAKAEWNEQAAAFAEYVTGKTPEEVGSIAVNERTAPTDADLASSVTIAIGDFKALVQEAAK